MNPFEAFPNAIESEAWELGEVKMGTDIGNQFCALRFLDVIEDEAERGSFDRSPNPDYLEVKTLLYAKPEQLPTLNPAALVSGYLIRNAETEQFYKITEAGVGKDQETGEVTHLELLLQQTEVAVAYGK